MRGNTTSPIALRGTGKDLCLADVREATAQPWKWFPKYAWEGFFNPICTSRVLGSNQTRGVARALRRWKRDDR